LAAFLRPRVIVIERLYWPARVSTSTHHTDQIFQNCAGQKEVTDMKAIVPPVAELLARLHDNAADVVKLIEAIPALKSDDLPQIVNRVHILGKLKELEAE
jgi:hypothetical protein